MPIYQYKCAHCSAELEEIRKFSERDNLVPCHKCKVGYYMLQISVPAKPIFNGSGFYETDYKKKESK